MRSILTGGAFGCCNFSVSRAELSVPVLIQPKPRGDWSVGSANENDCLAALKRNRRPSMPKVIWSCSHCGTVLPLWQVRCTNCRRLAVSWLHLIVGLCVTLSAVFVVLKLL